MKIEMDYFRTGDVWVAHVAPSSYGSGQDWVTVGLAETPEVALGVLVDEIGVDVESVTVKSEGRQEYWLYDRGGETLGYVSEWTLNG